MTGRKAVAARRRRPVKATAGTNSADNPLSAALRVAAKAADRPGVRLWFERLADQADARHVEPADGGGGGDHKNLRDTG